MGSPASVTILSNGTNSICFTIIFTIIDMVYCDLCNIIQDVARSRIWWPKEWNFHRTTCENPKSGFVCSWLLLLKHCGPMQIKPRPIVRWTRPLFATIFKLFDASSYRSWSASTSSCTKSKTKNKWYSKCIKWQLW